MCAYVSFPRTEAYSLYEMHTKGLHQKVHREGRGFRRDLQGGKRGNIMEAVPGIRGSKGERMTELVEIAEASQ